jgi:hypothetical protein
LRNAIHASSSGADFEREKQLYFSSNFGTTA